MPNPQIIADDIFATIKNIVEQSKKLDNIRPFSNEEQELLTKIGSMISVLYEKLNLYYQQDEHSYQLAFQRSFDYPLLCKNSQTLEIIISWMYIVLKAIQRDTSYVLIIDVNHTMYAEGLINNNKNRIRQLLYKA